MTLVYILAATFFGGVVSVMLAAALSAPLLGLIVRHLVSLSTGVLLGTALLHVLPEAFEAGAPPDALFLTLLGGLMFFFLLEKAELYRHGHHHEHDHHTVPTCCCRPWPQHCRLVAGCAVHASVRAVFPDSAGADRDGQLLGLQ